MSIMDFKWNSGRTNISEAKKIRVYIYICTIIITHAWIEFNSKFAQFTVIDSHFCNLSIFTQQGTDLRKRSTSWGFWASGSTNPFWTKRPRSNSKPNTQPNQKNKKKYTHKTQKRLGQNPRFWHEMQQFPQLSHNTVCVFEVVRWCCIIQLWGRGGTEDAWKTESLSHTCKQTDSANKWEWVRVSESEKKKYFPWGWWSVGLDGQHVMVSSVLIHWLDGFQTAKYQGLLLTRPNERTRLQLDREKEDLLERRQYLRAHADYGGRDAAKTVLRETVTLTSLVVSVTVGQLLHSAFLLLLLLLLVAFNLSHRPFRELYGRGGKAPCGSRVSEWGSGSNDVRIEGVWVFGVG